jgi:hypothetical protein
MKLVKILKQKNENELVPKLTISLQSLENLNLENQRVIQYRNKIFNSFYNSKDQFVRTFYKNVFLPNFEDDANE